MKSSNMNIMLKKILITVTFMVIVCSGRTSGRATRTPRTGSSDSSRRNNRNNHLSGSASQPTRNERDNLQYWMCPEVTCPTLSPTCRSVEFLVLEYNVVGRDGRTVNVRCQSCDYCLDGPFQDRRRKRDLASSAKPEDSVSPVNQPHHRRHHRCPVVTCPSTPSGCLDLRLTDVLVDDRKCKKCPACYDNTVLSENSAVSSSL